MSSKGGSIRLPNGLTPKENAFTATVVKQIAEGKPVNGRAAILEHYDTTDPQVASGIATENFRKPRIQEAIQKALASNGLSIEKSLAGISELAEAKEYKMSGETKLKANIEILKLFNAYPGQKQSSHETNINIFTGLSYEEAKKKYESMTSQTTGFVEEAELV